MKYLNVAEKPSVAKEIARILSNGSCSNVIKLYYIIIEGRLFKI